jgi:hypothetical protein
MGVMMLLNMVKITWYSWGTMKPLEIAPSSC